jgi:hypothetical protein
MLYMYTLKHFAKLFAWISIFLILVCLIAIGAYCMSLSKNYPSENQAGTYLKWVAIGVWIVAALYVVALLCLWRSLHISLSILEAASDFVGTNLRVVLVPIAFFIVNVIVFLCWILALIYVFSVGDIDNGEVGT